MGFKSRMKKFPLDLQKQLNTDRKLRRSVKNPHLIKMLAQGVKSATEVLKKMHKGESYEAFKARRKACNQRRRQRESL